MLHLTYNFAVYSVYGHGRHEVLNHVGRNRRKQNVHDSYAASSKWPKTMTNDGVIAYSLVFA